MSVRALRATAATDPHTVTQCRRRRGSQHNQTQNAACLHARSTSVRDDRRLTVSLASEVRVARWTAAAQSSPRESHSQNTKRPLSRQRRRLSPCAPANERHSRRRTAWSPRTERPSTGACRERSQFPDVCELRIQAIRVACSAQCADLLANLLRGRNSVCRAAARVACCFVHPAERRQCPCHGIFHTSWSIL